MKRTLIIFILVQFVVNYLFSYSLNAASSMNGNISVSAEILGAGGGGNAGGGGAGGGLSVPDPVIQTQVIFQGMAYPKAFITLLKSGKVAGTVLADSRGDFSITLTGATAGVWDFGVYAEDAEKRKSVTLGFSVSILNGTKTTVSGIYISPTIALFGSAYKKGEDMKVFGYSYPESELNVFVSSPEIFVKKTVVSKDGKWDYSFGTNILETGNHAVKVKSQTSEDKQSAFSETMTFKVFDACQGADLNFDDKINLIDFSILLYFWDNTNPSNICADINSDKSVNLTDFSIMMYWWNG
jgi:hypothetical protein